MRESLEFFLYRNLYFSLLTFHFALARPSARTTTNTQRTPSVKPRRVLHVHSTLPARRALHFALARRPALARAKHTNTMSNEENTNIPRRRTDRITPQGKHTRLRNILNIIFMLGAVIGLIIYFYSDKTIGAYVILAAIGVKLVECSIRLIN